MDEARKHMHFLLAAAWPCWYRGRPLVKISLQVVTGAEMFADVLASAFKKR